MLKAALDAVLVESMAPIHFFSMPNVTEQAIRDKGRSRLEDPGAWFAEYHSGPVTRR